jgi:phosphoribosyl-ATP pyrophosphohydrolase/phosphoribosyl-AMP cyclohydrolase
MNAGAVMELDWDKGGGLLPAIVQDARSGSVLMLGYMNREALRQTLDRGRVTFFSRRRRQLWTKGETSGNFLTPVTVSADCDRDTILVQALPAGAVCHAGTATCFPEAGRNDAECIAFLAALEGIIEDRIATRPDGSYTAQLVAQGQARLAQKVGEEGLELALAAVTGNDAALVAETADLVYHVLVLLKQRGRSLQDVVDELESRHANPG